MRFFSFFLFLILGFMTLPVLADSRAYPDSSLTPGATLPVKSKDICHPGYSKKVRNVPQAVKNSVYTRYHVKYVHGADEVDHLISLELGGSNAITNLWPEPYVVTGKYAGYGATQKDSEENELHRKVCAGEESLRQAQYEISHDWIKAYNRDLDGGK